MDAEHLLKIPQSESDEHIVVNVKKNGPGPLDLRLVATDGSDVYVSKIKQSNVYIYQVKHSPINEKEWENVLSSTLLITTRNDEKQPNTATPEKLELTASIAQDQLLLVFRRNISGITQRLGEIVLPKDDDEAIELYDWAAAAADMTANLATAIRDLDGKYQAQSEIVKKLKEQLEDLIQAKKDHERSLMEKFVTLLNAKKLKIRDQQRLLAGAKVDPRAAAQIRDARQSQISRSPQASRAGKRKADGKSPQTTDTESGDSESERKPAAEPESDLEKETPPHSDQDATEDEDDDANLGSGPLTNTASGKGKVLDRESGKGHLSQSRSPTPPPPPRELPFPTEKKTVATTKSQPVHEPPIDANKDDSETSDDEL